MKSRPLMIMALIGTLGVAQSNAVIYTDPTGDVFTGAGDGILDISSVEVNNTATDLIFTINVTGDPVATDWGKYMISIDTTPGGDTTGNGWGRPISLTSGMDYWIGSWVDSGNGAELYTYAGSWSLTEATYNAPPGNDISISKNISSVTVTMPFANLGIGIGNSFNFDVYSSGGGGSDSAVDSLANPNQAISDWPGPYSSGLTLTYTLVPEPTMATLLGMGGLLLVGRFMRRRN